MPSVPQAHRRFIESLLTALLVAGSIVSSSEFTNRARGSITIATSTISNAQQQQQQQQNFVKFSKLFNSFDLFSRRINSNNINNFIPNSRRLKPNSNLRNTSQDFDDWLERLDIHNLALKRGFGLESHKVVTRDGYILTTHRLINPQLFNNNNNATRTTSTSNRQNNTKTTSGVIILQHGILCASSFFLLNSSPSDQPQHFNKRQFNNTSSRQTLITSNSLAFALSNLGYDVWLTNFRGSQYAREHTDPKLSYGRDARYWNFDVDSLIEHDLEASVSYILKVSSRSAGQNYKKQRYTFIGHSLGATVGLGALLVHSKTPLTRQMTCSILMAPVASTQFMRGGLMPMFQLASLLYDDLAPFPGASDNFARFARHVCRFAQRACGWLASMFIGAKQSTAATNEAKYERNSTSLNANNGHHLKPLRPASDEDESEDEMSLCRSEYHNQVEVFVLMMHQSVSVHMLKHIVQVHLSGRLSRFDYGPEENERRYGGSRMAPSYNLSQIHEPHLKVAIVSGPSDAISTQGEVDYIAHQLEGNVGKFKRIPIEVNPFNHMDLITSRDAGELVNRRVIEFILENNC